MRAALPLPLALALALGACSTDNASSASSPPAEVPARVSPSTLADAGLCGFNCEPFASRPCTDSNGNAATEVCAESGLAWYTCGTENDKAAPSLCAEGDSCLRKVGGLGSGLMTCQCDPAKRDGGCPCEGDGEQDGGEDGGCPEAGVPQNGR